MKRSHALLSATIAVAMATVLGVSAATAQEDPTQAPPVQKPPTIGERITGILPARPATAAQLSAKLAAVMPQWDASILQAPVGRNWPGDLRPVDAAKVLRDEALAARAQEAPKGALLVETATSVLRLDPAGGRLRYVNRAREPKAEAAQSGLRLPENAESVALDALAQLGFPREEIGAVSALTQSAAAGRAGAQAEWKGDLYRVISVERAINKLPVLGSSARIAINAEGQVQRLRATWPAFRIDPSDKLLGRDAVQRSAVEFLLDQNVKTNVDIKARLGYAPVSPRGGAMLPALILSVSDGPTPMLLTVPVVSPSAADDQ